MFVRKFSIIRTISPIHTHCLLLLILCNKINGYNNIYFFNVNSIYNDLNIRSLIVIRNQIKDSLENHHIEFNEILRNKNSIKIQNHIFFLQIMPSYWMYLVVTPIVCRLVFYIVYFIGTFQLTLQSYVHNPSYLIILYLVHTYYI